MTNSAHGYYSVWYNGECRDIVYGSPTGVSEYAAKRFGKVIGLSIEPSDETTAKRFHNDDDADDCDNEDAIEAWHDGYFGKNKPLAGPLLIEWEAGAAQAVTDRRAPRPAPVERPEGYYHSRLNGED